MSLFKRVKIDTRNFEEMSLREIAEIIQSELLTKEDDLLLESVKALGTLEKVNDKYYLDSGLYVVLSVLEKSKKWKTQSGQKIRKELQKRVDDYNKSIRKT
jgi:hypothetical protein